MIEELHIKNFALIDESVVTFKQGLNLLTGETGAGKSILIGALGLVLGSKADSTSIRTGCEEAEVSAVFSIDNDNIRTWLKEHDLEPDEENLIIRRKIKSSGRGAVYIQSKPFTLADLSDLGEYLVDIHGQHAHQSLFYVDHHRRFLDQYGKLERKNQTVQRYFSDLKLKTEELAALKSSIEDREKEEEILSFSIAEIEKASLKNGEEEELRNQLKRMDQAEELYSVIDQLMNLLPENKGGSLSSLRNALSCMETLSSLDETKLALKERFSNAFYEIEDISDSIASFKDELSFSPGEKEIIEDRLAVIRKICRKYGPGVDQVFEHLEESKKSLSDLENSGDALRILSGERDTLEEQLITEAKELSEARIKWASSLEHAVVTLLASLGMPSSVFSVSITQKTGDQGQSLCGRNGLDRVEFLFSANKGEPLKPLKNVASGGEISRVMLAIKSALAGTDGIPILVFDEIDAGIGGEVASSVGQHLKSLASFHQILCITHLASIAVYADNHIKVSKSEQNDRTHTELTALLGQNRVTEVARMLSGDSEGSASLAHAEELLKGASG